MLALVIERMANDPLPLAERPRRVAALERELDELYRVEEVLVAAAIAAGSSKLGSTRSQCSSHVRFAPIASEIRYRSESQY